MRIVIILLIIVIMPFSAFSAGLTPWEFGMSKSEVSSFSKYGPYRTFSNGDIETYNGIYDGKAENVQFFFDNNDKLARIGVYLYEGTDIKEAQKAWKRAYDSFTQKYGKIEIFGTKRSSENKPIDATSLSIAAAANVDMTSELSPINQPKDMFVSSKFWSQDVQGTRYYWVTIFLDNPNSH